MLNAKLVEQRAKHCLSVLVLFRLCHAYVEGSPRVYNLRSGRAWERGYTRPSFTHAETSPIPRRKQFVPGMAETNVATQRKF